MKQDATMKKCPRCGSKQLHKENSLNRGVSVVICQDCDSVFELHKPRGKQRPRTLRDDDSDFDENRWQDYVEDDEDDEDYDEDLAYEDGYDDDHEGGHEDHQR
jgi:transcription initiation factor TFIIIB Brf1 subunit/transcription initiation factor TFIIB